MGFIGYYGEHPGFLGGTNVVCKFKVYFFSPIATHIQPCCPPPNSDSNLLTLAINSLWIPLRDSKVRFPWAYVGGFCVNDSHIFSAAGANTTTMMVSFVL